MDIALLWFSIWCLVLADVLMGWMIFWDLFKRSYKAPLRLQVVALVLAFAGILSLFAFCLSDGPRRADRYFILQRGL